MTIKTPLLILVAILTTSSSERDGDLLQSACSEVCRDWENWRKECLKTKCQLNTTTNTDWFPCFMSCWSESRQCVTQCADNFWQIYTKCSHQCLGHFGRKRQHCRRKCAVKRLIGVHKPFLKPLRCKNKPKSLRSSQKEQMKSKMGHNGK